LSATLLEASTQRRDRWRDKLTISVRTACALFSDAEQLSDVQGAGLFLLQQAYAVLEEIQRLQPEVDAVSTASNSAVHSH
jgi:hypothetical protein